MSDTLETALAVLAYVICGYYLGSVLLTVAEMSYWRFGNWGRMLRYRRRTGRWCKHEWGAWHNDGAWRDSACEHRWCDGAWRCGAEQRRDKIHARVFGP